jgi:uncharacterized protein YcnI
MAAMRRLAQRSRCCAALTLAVCLVPSAGASAHAVVSPAVSLSDKLQLYSLAVPTEKENVTTREIVLTVPPGFAIDSFAPPPAGWRQQVQQSGSGEGAAVTRVTWTGGHTPTGQDSVFQFLADPAAAGSYRFTVQQNLSDGSIVNWSGPESAATPAPVVQARSSSSVGGGGGTSTVGLLALIMAVLALAASAAALAGRGGRDLV